MRGVGRNIPGMLLIDRVSSMSRFREHATFDGLATACGLLLQTPMMREPQGTVGCVRCARIALMLATSPAPIPTSTSVDTQALVMFLGEALLELRESGDTIRAVYALRAGSVASLFVGLADLVDKQRHLASKRILVLALAVIRGTRSVRQLQALRQELVYGA